MHQYRRRGVTLVEVLVCIGVISILMGLLMPAVQQAREAARRTHCLNNLKQAALGLHLFHDQFGRLPEGSLVESEPTRNRAWSSQILPFVDQGALDAEVDEVYAAGRMFDRGTPIELTIALYICPSDPRINPSPFVPRYRHTVGMLSYLGCNGTSFRSEDGLLYGNSHVGLSDAIDGTSSTILLGERPPSSDLELGWWMAGVGQDGFGSLDSHLGTDEINLRYAGCETKRRGLTSGDFWEPCSAIAWWSPHGDLSSNFAFADGSVRTLSGIDLAVLKSLGTRAGHEVVELDE